MVTVEILFDGGSRGNPGVGYGSYQLVIDGVARPVQRLLFDGVVTNNEAEYDTLIAALDSLVERARDPRAATVIVRGDSRLVIEQVRGTWKAKDARMRARRDRVLLLARSFSGVCYQWHPRALSVDALGH